MVFNTFGAEELTASSTIFLVRVGLGNETASWGDESTSGDECGP